MKYIVYLNGVVNLMTEDGGRATDRYKALKYDRYENVSLKVEE